MPGTHSLRRIVVFICGALSVLGCVGSTDAPQGESGSLSLELVLADGTLIEEVDWRITGNGMDMQDTINVSAPGSTASVEVYGLPPGEEDYTITLTAVSVDGDVTCEGSEDFNVEVGETTDVRVILNCKLPRRFGSVRVNGEFNICAELLKMVVSPLVTSIGNDIDLRSEAVDRDSDDITTLWSNDGGAFGDPNAESTTYTCLEEGIHLITVSVTDNDEVCDMATWTVPVECVPGDGLECVDDEDCDTGEVCNDNNQCVPEVECSENEDCDTGEICLDNECVPDVECIENADCNDGNECTDNECTAGVCSNPNNDNTCEGDTGVCKDGGCIITDLCDMNICDENDTECNNSMCDAETGDCFDTPIDGPCNDGTGTCLAGECVDNCLDVTCDDLGECIANECNPQTGACEQTDLDGELCENETGVCVEGDCQPSVVDPPPKSAAVPNACIVGGAGAGAIVELPFVLTMDPAPIEAGATVDISLDDAIADVSQTFLQGAIFAIPSLEVALINSNTRVTVGIASGGTGPTQELNVIASPSVTVPLESADGAPGNTAGTYNCYQTIAPGFDEFVMPLNLIGTKACGVSCGGGPTTCAGAGRPLVTAPSQVVFTGPASAATYNVTGASGEELCFQTVGPDVNDPGFPGSSPTDPTYLDVAIITGILEAPITCGPGTLGGTTPETTVPLTPAQQLCFPIGP